MLHQTLSKGWCHARSGLLLGLIVRARGRLVEARSRFAAAENRSASPAQRPGGNHPGHPRPVAPLPQREGLLAFRLLSSALLLPYPLFAEPTQGRRIRALEPELRLLQRAFAQELACPSAVFRVMDTTLVPAIVRVRASRKGLFAGQATFGRSASKTEWVYGFKAALVVDPEGVITAFGLAPAAYDERPIGEALVASDRYVAYLADKGFTGVEWERLWMEIYGALVAATPKSNSRRAWTKADRRWASGKRQIIEGVIGQLKDFFCLEGHRAKTLGGLLTRLAAKVAAYTCAQRINDSLNRPLRHLADLLV
jgi:transposase